MHPCGHVAVLERCKRMRTTPLAAALRSLSLNIGRVLPQRASGARPHVGARCHDQGSGEAAESGWGRGGHSWHERQIGFLNHLPMHLRLPCMAQHDQHFAGVLKRHFCAFNINLQPVRHLTRWQLRARLPYPVHNPILNLNLNPILNLTCCAVRRRPAPCASGAALAHSSRQHAEDVCRGGTDVAEGSAGRACPIRQAGALAAPALRSHSARPTTSCCATQVTCRHDMMPEANPQTHRDEVSALVCDRAVASAGHSGRGGPLAARCAGVPSAGRLARPSTRSEWQPDPAGDAITAP